MAYDVSAEIRKTAINPPAANSLKKNEDGGQKGQVQDVKARLTEALGGPQASGPVVDDALTSAIENMIKMISGKDGSVPGTKSKTLI